MTNIKHPHHGDAQQVRIAVVIVNYRTAPLVEDCLRSLWRLDAPGAALDIVVVDNCSGDGSHERLRSFVHQEPRRWPVRLVASRVNGGFAHGNNVALRSYAGGALRRACEFIWLLNPDTQVCGGDLDRLLSFMREHPRAGIAGTRIVDAQGAVQCSAFRRHSWLSEMEGALCMGPVTALLRNHVVALPPPRQSARVDWVSGASMFIRREVLSRVGLLDESYFMYFEETDYCLSAQAAGFEVWYCPELDVLHLEGSASGVHPGTAKRRPRYWFESRARFFRKNHSPTHLHVANAAWILCYPLGRIWQRLRRKTCADPPRLWWDFVSYNYLHTRA